MRLFALLNIPYWITSKLAEEEDARRNDARLSEADANRRLAFNEEEIYDAADYRSEFVFINIVYLLEALTLHFQIYNACDSYW